MSDQLSRDEEDPCPDVDDAEYPSAYDMNDDHRDTTSPVDLCRTRADRLVMVAFSEGQYFAEVHKLSARKIHRLTEDTRER
ncbi:hypothetical protein ACIHDR_48970 [Nocardia sp. NPDC052278]|uniref:hypothetical protein n=1 Tax=unclassified Nocardia TaxID=2637762 RepID=UPI00368E9961